MPLAFEISKAEGSCLFDAAGKKYIDLVGGISVANTGHRHPSVLEAIRAQLDAYMHVMVYGEFIESPQVKYARMLSEQLPPALDSVFFTNSGAEAIEGAMKLAKRATGRTQIIGFKNSYHGSTQGALSIMGSETWRNAFRPLLPGILHLEFNSHSALEEINTRTACVIAETVQAEAGLLVPDKTWLQALRKKCDDTGTLLVLDEIQTGFGRTGALWGFEHYEVIPDILVLGKALGGGMPLGAFISDKKLMDYFTRNPVLGHITTFGGHPVCCAAGLASMNVLLGEKLIESVPSKEAAFRAALTHPSIKSIRSFGCWLALELDSAEICKRVTDRCIENGVMIDWFLFAPECLRISPPLVISEEDIQVSAGIILKALSSV